MKSICVLILSLWTYSHAQDQLQSDWEQVLDIVPPRSFPVNGPWPVTVGIQVDPSGLVSSFCVEDRMSRMAIKISGDQLRQWLFEPIQGDEQRIFILKLVYYPTETWEKPLTTVLAFEDPFTLHIRTYLPSIFRLERRNNAIPIKSCEKHDQTMEVEIVPCQYGLIVGFDEKSRSSLRASVVARAMRRHFPNSPARVRCGFCIPGSETHAEVYVCTVCKTNRESWFKKHKRFVEEFY